MGLLSSIWNAADRVLPDEQVMGLLNRVRAPQMAQPQAAALTPPGPLVPQAQPVGTRTPNRMQILGAMFSDMASGGQGQNLARIQQQRLLADTHAKQQQDVAYASEMADRLGMPPEFKVLLRMDPAKGVEAIQDYSKARVLNRGDVLNVAGQNIAGAPVIEKFDDRFGVINPVSLESFYTEARDPTFSEMTNQQNADETIRHHDMEHDVQQGRLGIDRQRLGVQAGHYANQDSIARQREGRLRSGGSRGGGARVPALPPGFVMEK